MLSKLIAPFFDQFRDFSKQDNRKIILLQLTIFLIISVLLMLKPLGTSLMLNNFGIDIMPKAYIGISIAAIIVHFFLMFLRRFFSLAKAMTINYIFHILVLISLTIALYYKVLTGWSTVGVYIYFNLFSLITVTLFFQYCQSLLSIREAKKVLSYIGVGAIAGGVFGGYFSSAVVSIYGNIQLLIAAALFLLVAMLCMQRIHNDYKDDLEEPRKKPDFLSGQLLRIFYNKHVSFIAGIIGLGVIASKLIDYQFTAVAYINFIDEDELTAFFGFWFSSFNVIALIIQLFLVNVIIDRIGITNSMSILPLTLLVALIGFLILPVLAIGIVLRMVDGSMKQSIYKTSTEINIMPLPSYIRDRAKTLVDVVIDSLATGFAGLLIYFLLRNPSLSMSVITMVTIGIVMLWVALIFFSRNTYLKQLALLVYKKDKDDEHLSSTPSKFLQKYLKDTTRKSKKRLSKLVSLTRDDKVAIKVAAINAISEEYSLENLERLDHLRSDNSILVRKKYFEEKLLFIKSKEELQSLYNKAKPQNKIVITGSLARSIGNHKKQQLQYNVFKRIDQSYQILLENKNLPSIFWRTWMTAVAHSRYKKHYPVIVANLNQFDDEALKMYALFAIRKGKLKSLFKHVLECRVDSKNLNRLYKTLGTFPKLILEYAKRDHKNHPKKLVRALNAFEFIDSQEHLDFLIKKVKYPRRKVRVAALKTIGKLKDHYPYLNYYSRKNKSQLYRISSKSKSMIQVLVLLQNLKQLKGDDPEKVLIIERAIKDIRKELKINIHILFTLMDLIYHKSNMLKVYKGFKKNKGDAVLDYLDQYLPYKLKKKIVPVVELSQHKILKSEYLVSKEIPEIRKRLAIKFLRQLNPTRFEEVIKIF